MCFSTKSVTEVNCWLFLWVRKQMGSWLSLRETWERRVGPNNEICRQNSEKKNRRKQGKQGKADPRVPGNHRALQTHCLHAVILHSKMFPCMQLVQTKTQHDKCLLAAKCKFVRIGPFLQEFSENLWGFIHLSVSSRRSGAHIILALATSLACTWTCWPQLPEMWCFKPCCL